MHAGRICAQITVGDTITVAINHNELVFKILYAESFYVIRIAVNDYADGFG